ncbi:phosphoribosylaminoimidazolesuccinocarboxamide synthase [Microbacterium protaetiae]|uniref:Phosphoribosylaminoimidazole-succinocarboxamide synthase n=1 Tax=Microbacterium protaetiae TaxID=2509458 RepID=A0A4P6EC93_9MICO|nr:phosphoribosylaminoimidazolesuccinocarboxamide synthase [Microbacterium protaetiae]
MLVVASDRVSSFDYMLEPPIPGKGELLTTLSLWWFDRLAGGDGGTPIPNHLIDGATPPEAVAGRAMVVRKLDMLPVECVVRGYLTGSGWAEYQASQTVCGIHLPDGLHNGDRLPAPIFTPAYKAPLGEHDENISFDRAVELLGAAHAEKVRALSLDIYDRAAATAEEHGLILADTKFEFGIAPDGTVTLADEVLTADSSRYWDAEAWRTGSTPAERMASFDKQIVRDWLSAHWAHAPGGSAQRASDASSGRGEGHAPGGSAQRASDASSGRGEAQQSEPPTLPAEIVERTAARYRELIARLMS